VEGQSEHAHEEVDSVAGQVALGPTPVWEREFDEGFAGWMAGNPALASTDCGKYIEGMSYAGTVKNGVVVLPPGVKLAEGTEVDVVPRDLRVADDPFLQAIAGAAKPRTNWPKDYALNHGFYVSGEPKKA
jgi:hypothetical protein